MQTNNSQQNKYIYLISFGLEKNHSLSSNNLKERNPSGNKDIPALKSTQPGETKIERIEEQKKEHPSTLATMRELVSAWWRNVN